jgi:uncharacterized membrane protein
VSEDDETAASTATATVAEPVATIEDNSLGRLLTLADGVFAIAMTLLALDLAVPTTEELVGPSGGHATNHMLQHYLSAHSSNYLSYFLSFYLVANYWLRHRRMMRSVITVHPALIRDTLLLLLIVAAMPFPSALLGTYGSFPISLALYGATNIVATVLLMVLDHDIRRLDLADGVPTTREYTHRWQTWHSLTVFVLCIPAGYILGHYGPWVLVLLALPNRVALFGRLFRRRTA